MTPQITVLEVLCGYHRRGFPVSRQAPRRTRIGM
jgi:hypothetical protein